MRTLAIDPGSTHSAYAVVDDDLVPQRFDKVANHAMLGHIYAFQISYLVIEQIGHYGTGMPAGQDVFDTCIWIGRFIQAHDAMGEDSELTKRATVKTHLCGTPKASDANVTQALVDRFAPNVRNRGKGTKDQPGWFYGFHHDIWQAYALAVYHHDTRIALTAPT